MYDTFAKTNIKFWTIIAWKSSAPLKYWNEGNVLPSKTFI